MHRSNSRVSRFLNVALKSSLEPTSICASVEWPRNPKESRQITRCGPHFTFEVISNACLWVASVPDVILASIFRPHGPLYLRRLHPKEFGRGAVVGGVDALPDGHYANVLLGELSLDCNRRR